MGSSAPSTTGARLPSIYLVAEEIGSAPDEAYAKLVDELSRALRSRSSLQVHLTRPGPSGATAAQGATRGVSRMRAIASRALWRDIRRAHPETVVYVSRSSTTLAGLVRSRILQSMARRASMVMIGLQPRALGRGASVVARALWPDLLLVTTQKEAQRARSLGAHVDLIATGVDLDRYRPAREGEKATLRRQWGLPEAARVVLHVGHLTSGRNLESLVPLARRPGTHVVMVASSQWDPESPGLQRMLEGAGVSVFRGYLPHVEEVYRLADCYVFPTCSTDHAIAMPLSVLEAMATGLPVVATRFGALAERFSAAEGVILVDDPAGLADAVDRALDRPFDTRALAGGFTWDAVADRVAAARG